MNKKFEEVEKFEELEVFPWNENFETGIQEVDEQHKTRAFVGWYTSQKQMDKIDNIRAESSISKLEKITATWIKKAYRKHFSEGKQISQTDDRPGAACQRNAERRRPRQICKTKCGAD